MTYSIVTFSDSTDIVGDLFMADENQTMDYLSKGGKLTSPDHVPPRYRAELMKIMATFVDSALAGASGFADCVNGAPGLRERIAASKIVTEKLNSAQVVLTLMEGFGANLAMYVTTHTWNARLDRNVYLGTRRWGNDSRLNIFYSPIYGWNDSVVLNYLMGHASAIQLDSLSRCSYQPLGNAMDDIAKVEVVHADAAEKALVAIMAEKRDHTDVQASVNYWYPRALDSFASSASANNEQLVNMGLRAENVDSLKELWQKQTDEIFNKIGLKRPA